MGNVDSNSQFEQGHLLLEFDHPHCVSGRYLTGKGKCYFLAFILAWSHLMCIAHLELTEPYPAVSINLRLQGKEYFNWIEGRYESIHKDPDASHIKSLVKHY